MDTKAKRYDRQVRVWGAHGQQRLEAARVCVLNCGPTGCEALKNLVLGGVAAFTVVDGARVGPSDMGNNFLVGPNSLGRPRAQVVTELLKELNESVAGSFVEEWPGDRLRSDPDFFGSFAIVIATQMPEHEVKQLDKVCQEKKVPLLVARSYGLVGLLRISAGEHTVIETRPDDQIPDLRLHAPWPELAEYAASFDLNSMDVVTHKHVPYAVLLLQVAAQWKNDHGGLLPSTDAEKVQFKAAVADLNLKNADGVPFEEENVVEAKRVAYQVWCPPSITSALSQALSDDCAVPSPSSSEFWILVAALKEFMESEGKGHLPLEGSLPDMTSTTEFYLQLQNIYRERAQKDMAAMEQIVRRILEGIGRDVSSVSRDSLRQFCKNARSVNVIRYPTISDEFSDEAKPRPNLAALLGREDTAINAGLYVLLRAADRFHATHSRYPGVLNGDVMDGDLPLLKSLATGILNEAGASPCSVSDDLIGEMCRFGAAELHCVAAVVGGMAAQEAVKLLTKQFVALSSTLIYNGMSSTTALVGC